MTNPKLKLTNTLSEAQSETRISLNEFISDVELYRLLITHNCHELLKHGANKSTLSLCAKINGQLGRLLNSLRVLGTKL
jgi:hypothetical protein